jgi:FeS assembly protein SufD
MTKTAEINASGLAPVQITVPRFTPVESAVFAKKRAEAQKALTRLQPPSDKKYTNWIRRNMADRFEGKDVASPTPKIMTDSKKVSAMTLAEAIKAEPKLVESYLLGKALPADAHYFSALSGALYSDGAFIVVPADTKAEITIELPVESGKLNAFRIVIVAEKNSEVTVFEKSVAAPKSQTIITTGTEVYAGANASVSYYALQDCSNTVTHLAAYRSHQERDSKLDWLIGSFGGSFTQVLAESGLAGEGAESNIRGTYFGTGENHYEQQLVANHLVGHTTSNTYARGVVADMARAVYRGMIKIQQGAHGSSADQNGHAMLLGNDAHVDAIPGLEIDADDVVAGHGATVGQISPEKLFYLMARGLSESAARKLIIRGFFEDLFGRINSESVRIEFQRVVEARLA